MSPANRSIFQFFKQGTLSGPEFVQTHHLAGLLIRDEVLQSYRRASWPAP